ncbi:MAG TPA: phosphopantetheine-binding protein [Pyrinomonadaceae bacterium]|jgi:acyl carrier protein|nr:phosphopantetheine-binding protein [Pyrinomonadaceae bacterium]
MSYVEARTVLEERLAGMWRQVLEVESVGAEDDFFELGGDSVVATQLLTRVNEAFAIKLPLRDFFESPTVAGMALLVVQKQAEQADPEALARLLEEVRRESRAAA